MKLAYSVATNGRNQMHERQRRARAGAAPLKARFPEISSLRLEFDFSDAGPFTPVSQVTEMHPAARAYFVFPCPYFDCDGEFDLSAPITTMVSANEMHCEGKINCTGHRTRDIKGRAQCDLTLAYRIGAQRG
jgi:hypothetical protein